ncbi:MAG: glycosyltransferase [Oscillospiraceae bacterium]|nr:glycosyltransferase [Oscillospiraceae bacterium]
MTAAQIKSAVKGMLRAASAYCSPLFHRPARISLEEARKELEGCAAKPAGTACAQNRLEEILWDVQIVIPAYNVQEYLEACMESVLSQKTRYSYHVVLVDDGAKDATPEICDHYADHPHVTVIHQANRGLSGARNTGMKELQGKYVLFLDSDDVLCPGALEGLLDTAFAHDCDLVEGGAYYLHDGRKTVMHSYSCDGKVENPYTQLHGHAWGKLYKRELLEKICFPEGYWYEDSLLSFMVFSMARNIWQSAQMVTAYRINQSGIVKSSKGKPRAVETYWITEMLLQERKKADLPFDKDFFGFMLLQIRLNQLRLSDLPEKVQEAAFVLTCDLMEQYFAPEIRNGREKQLIRALAPRDFGMFRMCCRFF